MCTGEKREKQMNQTELPECEKINKKEPSKDVQMTQEQAEAVGESLLKEVGLAEKADVYPAQLSGGQKQTVWWNI